MENLILKHRAAVVNNIMKSFGESPDFMEKAIDVEDEINPFEMEEWKSTLTKAELDEFEKAKHQDGDMHPNGKWVWRQSANGGKGDWRVANPAKRGRKSKTATASQDSSSDKTQKNDMSNMSDKEFDEKYNESKTKYNQMMNNKNVNETSKKSAQSAMEKIEAEKKRRQESSKKTKTTSEKKSSGDKFMSALKVYSNKYTDESKITVYKTDKGNWDTYYDGKRIGIVNKQMLTEKLAKEKGWYREDSEEETPKKTKTASEDTKTSEKKTESPKKEEKMVEMHNELENKFGKKIKPFVYASNGVSDLNKKGKKGYATWVGFEHSTDDEQPVDKNKMHNFIFKTAINQFLSAVNEKTGKEYTEKDVKVEDFWSSTHMYRLRIENKDSKDTADDSAKADIDKQVAKVKKLLPKPNGVLVYKVYSSWRTTPKEATTERIAMWLKDILNEDNFEEEYENESDFLKHSVTPLNKVGTNDTLFSLDADSSEISNAKYELRQSIKISDSYSRGPQTGKYQVKSAKVYKRGRSCFIIPTSKQLKEAQELIKYNPESKKYEWKK